MKGYRVGEVSEENMDDESTKEETLYVCGALHLWVSLNGGKRRMKAMLHGGAEINVLQIGLAEDYNLPMGHNIECERCYEERQRSIDTFCGRL